MKKILLLSLITLLFWGCGDDSAQQNTVDGTVAETISSANELPQKFAKYYKGRIGKSLNIVMRIEREGESIRGIYWYESKNLPITINGNFKDGSVEIQEYGQPNQLTGTFEGKYTTGKHLEGNWTNPKNTLTMDFVLDETDESSVNKPVAEEKVVAPIVLSKEYKKPDAVFEYAYPDFEKMGFQKIHKYYKNWVEKTEKTFEQDVKGGDEYEGMSSDYQGSSTIHYRGNGLISVYGGASYYYAGAAHPNSESFTELWNEESQKQYELKDLFAPGADWMTPVINFCKKDILTSAKADGNDDPSFAFPREPELYSHFLVGDQGMEFLFDAYSIGSYAEGPQSSVVPWKNLKSVIDMKGPLAPFAK